MDRHYVISLMGQSRRCCRIGLACYGGVCVIEAGAEKGHLILIEPDENVRAALLTLLSGAGWHVDAVRGCADIPQTHDDDGIAAVISESSLPGCAANDVLKVCCERGIPVIFTGHDLTVQAAVDLIQQGAADYLQKPFPQRRLLNLLNHLQHGHNE